MNRQQKSRAKTDSLIAGDHAILGMDIVSYSVFEPEDQRQAVYNLLQWVQLSLDYNGIKKDDFIWSHSGDGGYITFLSHRACRKAVDVAFDIARHCGSGDWLLRDGEPLRLRMGLHAGFVQDVAIVGMGNGQEVSGVGINTTARIMSLSSANQILVSSRYFEDYIKGQREHHFEIGPLHTRSVKHGVKVEVMNINRYGLCLNENEAAARQWQTIGDLWQQTIQEYELLIDDSMKVGSILTAMAAAKHLLAFKKTAAVIRLCQAISIDHAGNEFDFPVQRHELFSHMRSNALVKTIESSEPRLIHKDETICFVGDLADTCFFVVSGTVAIDRPGDKELIYVRHGELAGEFSLWMSGLRRTATLRAHSSALIIEIPIAELRQILQAQNETGVVYERIKQRVIDNVISSPDLFPNLLSNTVDFQAECEKYPEGAALDLSKRAYLIFNGKVKVSPSESTALIISAQGQASADSVVGIVSNVGKPDGKLAFVLEETVAVSLPHQHLLTLQNNNPPMQRAWDAMCGVRLGAYGIKINPFS